MAIYFYAPKPTEGLVALMHNLGATRIARHDGMNFLQKGREFIPKPKDTIICWGSFIAPIEGVTVINAQAQFPNDAYLNEHVLSAAPVLPHPAIVLYENTWSFMRAKHMMATGKPMGNIIPSSLLSTIRPMGLMTVKHAFRHRLHVFNGKVLADLRAPAGSSAFGPSKSHVSANTQQAIFDMLQQLELTFAAVTLFRTGKGETNIMLHKISTAPKLDSEFLVESYTQAFREKLESMEPVIPPMEVLEGI